MQDNEPNNSPLSEIDQNISSSPLSNWHKPPVEHNASVETVDPSSQIAETFSKYGQTFVDAVHGIYYSSNMLLRLLQQEYHAEESLEGAGGLDYFLFDTKEYEQLSDESKTQFIKDLIMFLSDAIQYKTRQIKSEMALDNSYYGKPRSNFIDRENLPYEKDSYDDFEFNLTTAKDSNINESSYSFEPESYEVMIKKLIEQLEDSSSDPRNNVDFLFNFWQKNQDPYYGPVIAGAVSRLDASMAVQKILENLPNGNEKNKRRLLSLLYRLELGRIGVSEQGVNYLGRRFDLEENNDINNFAHRLTADGKVGIFDKQKLLLGFFQLQGKDFTESDNTAVNQAVKKTLDSITIDQLFVPRPDETEDDHDQKQQILKGFKKNYFSTYLELFKEQEDKTGFRFNNLSFPEQGFVLSFLNEHSEGDLRQKFFDFIGNYGENGFYAFRSIEFDSDAGNKILALDQQITPLETEQLLKQYGETYKKAAEVAEWIKKVLLSDMENPSAKDLLEVNIIREQILQHAQDILSHPNTDEGEETTETQFLSGKDRLFWMNNELEKITALEPTIDNFELAQAVLSRYLTDNVASGEKLSLSEQVISDGLARLYDNQEFSLRDYEGKTTDTFRSLKALLNSLDEMVPQAATGDPEEKLVYDIGAGDGRIGIPLALSGCKVVGIDYSERMVKDSKTRPQEFRQAYQSNPNDHLVNSAKKAFKATNKTISETELRNIDQKIDIRHGNFFDFDAAKFKEDFGERQPDAVIIMWHTLGFAGDVVRMKQVLKNAYDILRPGGSIFIEMPDRNFGGYAHAIRDFHNSHPDQPFGAIKDAPSKSSNSPTEQDQSRATWRYFPKNSEIEDALESVRFDASAAMMESYFVKAQAESNAKLLIKENMFIAEKPLDQERLNKLTDYEKTLSDDRKGDEEKIENIREQIRAA